MPLSPEQLAFASAEAARRIEERRRADAVGDVNSVPVVGDQQQVQWAVKRHFLAAAYLCGASLSQLAGHSGCSVQAVQRKLAKTLPAAIREKLAAQRWGSGHAILTAAQVAVIADEFFSQPDKYMQMTVVECAQALNKISFEKEIGDAPVQG
jgi:hypothetical protein